VPRCYLAKGPHGLAHGLNAARALRVRLGRGALYEVDTGLQGLAELGYPLPVENAGARLSDSRRQLLVIGSRGAPSLDAAL